MREGEATVVRGPPLWPALWLRVVLFGAAYFACASVGSLLSATPGRFVSFWLPSGLYVGTLLRSEKRHWPAFVAASFFANVGFDLVSGRTLPESLLFWIGNSLEALAGAWLVYRFAGGRADRMGLRQVLALAVLSALLSTMLSATIGAAAVGYIAGGATYADRWLTWWSADVIGVLVLAPTMLAWLPTRPPWRDWRSSGRPAEAAVSLFGLAAITAFVFSHPWAAGHTKFLLVPLLMWSGLRFGIHGATAASLTVSLIAAWLTVHANVSLPPLQLRERVTLLQFFLASATLSGLVPAAVLAERERAREALAEWTGFTESVIKSLPGVFYLFDDAGRFLRWNDNLERVTGFTREEIAKLSPLVFFAGPERELIAQRIQQVLDEGAADVEAHLVAKDGRRTPYYFTGVRAFLQGRRCVVGLGIDISERRRAEERLREAARRKDEFLALLGHELRNPLAPIRTASHLLRLIGTSDTRAEKAQEMIERQIEHMARIVDDLLDVSRIARGKIALRKKHVDLSTLVGSVAEDYREAVEAKGVSLRLGLPETPLWVFGDPTRLAQIVGNVLHNSQKFTDQGRITVALEPDAVGKAAVLRVEDTGIGLANGIASRLFEPFAQGDVELARSRGGLGLGLALVKGLVELHGGTVQAASEGPGRGTRITINLPLVEAPAAQRGPLAEATAGRRLRVLVVEDNADAAESLQMFLEVKGHLVRTTGDGASALSEARTFAPDVILCDIGLPGQMDGYAVARAIRADPALQSTYLVALTGYGTEEDRRRARAAGFDLHLTKPTDPRALERLLEVASPVVH